MSDGMPWKAIVDDAAIFPPGDAPLHEATAAYAARSAEDGAELVGTFVLKDTDLPLVRGFGGPLSVVVTGGAGQLAGPIGLCTKLGLNLAGLEIAVRDPDDPAGNVRRVVAALRDAETDVPVHVELPATPAEGSWLAAADVVAEAELLLKFRTGGLEAAAFPTAAGAGRLDRRGARPRDAVQVHGRAAQRRTPHRRRRLRAPRLRQRAGGHPDAVRRCRGGRGWSWCWSSATARGWWPTPPELDLAGARRWFTSFGSCSVAEPLADLRELGLLA